MEVLRLVLATVDAASSRLWCGGGAWKGTKAAGGGRPPAPAPIKLMELRCSAVGMDKLYAATGIHGPVRVRRLTSCSK